MRRGRGRLVDRTVDYRIAVEQQIRAEMDLTNRSGGFPRLSRCGLGVMAAMLLTLGPVGLVAATSAGMASASVSGTVVYSAHESIPAPPASNFAGSAGGDGWGLAFTTTAVFNVFHHDSVLQVACHLQKNATPCWAPKTITDGSGNNFSSAGQPGLWMDQANGHLYVFATRVNDQTAGVVCIDTTQPGSVLDPFCGFTALSAVGAAPITFGFSNVSDPIVVGTSWYAFNAAPGTQAGTRNAMLCFSLTTFTACPSQPFAVDLGGSVTVTDSAPPPPMAAFGNEIVMPASLGSSQILACFDGSTHGTCSGAWPVDISSLSYGFTAGAPFPILNGDGTATGFCLAFASDPCWSLAGSPVSSPPGITAAVPPNTVWNGTAVTIGTRMYLPDFIANAVDCYDYTAGASCAGFPKVFDNLGFLYTVTVDPQRPTCIWVNSDHGTDQIQDFDAYTGGSCGEGPVRVLAASIVAPHSQCIPSNYTSLQVTAAGPAHLFLGIGPFRGLRRQSHSQHPRPEPGCHREGRSVAPQAGHHQRPAPVPDHAQRSGLASRGLRHADLGGQILPGLYVRGPDRDRTELPSGSVGRRRLRLRPGHLLRFHDRKAPERTGGRDRLDP